MRNEKKILEQMIEIYCRNNHRYSRPCSECAKLKEYANNKVDMCPYKEAKPFCSKCKIHCYNIQMRDDIRRVMRYSGPRIIFYHPITAIRHLISTRWSKQNT